jgi:hypothetical protein
MQFGGCLSGLISYSCFSEQVGRVLHAKRDRASKSRSLVALFGATS